MEEQRKLEKMEQQDDEVDIHNMKPEYTVDDIMSGLNKQMKISKNSATAPSSKEIKKPEKGSRLAAIPQNPVDL